MGTHSKQESSSRPAPWLAIGCALGLSACAAATVDEAGTEQLAAAPSVVGAEAFAMQRITSRLAAGVAPDELTHAELSMATLHRLSVYPAVSPEARATFDQVRLEFDAAGIEPKDYYAARAVAPTTATREFRRAVQQYAETYLFLRRHVVFEGPPTDAADVAGSSHGLQGHGGGTPTPNPTPTPAPSPQPQPPASKPSTFNEASQLALGVIGLIAEWVSSDDVVVLNWQCVDRCGWFWASCCAWQCQQEVVDGPAAGNCAVEGQTTTTNPMP